MANTDFINKDAFFFGVHDFIFSKTGKSGKLFNNYFGYHETGYPNSCKPNDVNEIPLVINHYFTKSYEEYLSRCKMWEKGGINPINHRVNCKEKFSLNDVNEVLGYQ